jgi:predicted alpha/beta hydrolase family esterase
MKNAIIIHGTEGYPEENWFPYLKNELEKRAWKVSVPQFPSPPVVPAKISEWWEVLKNYKIDENTLLVGHSLGGIFTLRILEKLEKPIECACFAGTPIGEKPIKNYDRDASFSGFNFDWGKIRKNAKRFVVFQSDNDPYVCLKNGEVLAEKLKVKLNFVPNAGHFNKTAGFVKFPQLLDEIVK